MLEDKSKESNSTFLIMFSSNKHKELLRKETGCLTDTSHAAMQQIALNQKRLE